MPCIDRQAAAIEPLSEIEIALFLKQQAEIAMPFDPPGRERHGPARRAGSGETIAGLDRPHGDGDPAIGRPVVAGRRIEDAGRAAEVTIFENVRRLDMGCGLQQ